jgi:ubiquinone/menaquinone biosynthesis C-methylase UbiE
MTDTDKAFTGSIPALYEQYLGPLIFEPYAADLARRLAGMKDGLILETAAGTGVVTRALARTLPKPVEIVATDLNQPMLDFAAGLTGEARVTWRQADALRLPFADAAFDVVVCQFGVMFFPDKIAAYREARRVLKPRGRFLFNVWDRIEDNDFAHIVDTTVAGLFLKDPPRFLARTPYGYYDASRIRTELSTAGFAALDVETLARRSRAPSARHPAIGFCQGTPLRNEIEARDKDRLGEATDAAAAAIAARFGTGAVDGKIQAHVIVATK